MDFYKKFNSMKVSENLFKDVKFYITGIVPEWIIQLLNNGGGKQELHITDFMTHLITGNNPIEDEIGEVRDIYEKPVVTQLWVIYCIKCDKLLPEDAFSPDSKQLFSGVKASVSKLGRDDSLTIWGLITFYGGKCTIDLDHTCTHLVLGKQEGIKFNRAVEKPILIVTPDWVIDSISDEERKDELYYHPKLINISGVSSNQSQNKRSRKLLSSIERRPREASPKVAIPVPPPVSFPEPTEQETKKEHSDEQSIFDSLIFTDDEEEEEVSDNESKSLLEQLTNPPPLLPTSAPNSSSEDREESPVSESISSSVHLQRSVSTTCQELSTLTRPVTSTFSMGSISAGLGSPMEAVSTSLPVVNSGDVSAGMSSSTSVVPEGDAVNSVAPATEASQTHTLMIKNGVHFSQVARVPATTGTSYSSLPPLSSSPYITQNTPSAVSSYSGTVPTTFIQGSHWQQSISTQGEEGLGGRPVIPPNKVITHSKPLNQTVGELSLPVSLSSSLPATSLTLAQPSGQQALPVHIVRPNSVTVAAGLGLLSSVPTASNTGKPFPVAAAANLLPLAGTSMQPCPQVQQAVSGVTVASSSMTQQVHSVGIPGAVVRLPAGVTHQQLQMMSNEERQRFLEQLHKKQLEEQRSAQRTGKPDTTLQYKNIPPGTIRYACPVRPQQSAQPQSPQASGTWPQSSVAQLSRVRPGSQVVTYTQGQGQVVTYTQGQVLPQTQTTTGPGWTQNPQQFPSAPGTATRVLVGQPGWQQQTPQQLTVTQQQSQTHGLSPQQLQLLHAQQLRQHFPLLTQQEAQQLIQTIPAHLRELQSRDNAGRYEYLSQLDPKEQQVVNHFYLRRHQQQMLQRQQQHLQAQHQAQQMKIGVPQQSPPWQQQQLQQQTQHQQAGQFSPGSPHSRPVPGRPVPQSYSGQTVVSPGQGSPHLVQSGQIVSQHVSPLASPHGQSPVPRQEGGGIIPHASLQGSNVPQNLVHQQNLVNPKTKTALANLLTNRLSGTVHQGVVVPPGSQGPIEVAAHLVQKPGMPQEGVQAVGDQVIIYQRRTLANITGTVTNNIVRPSGPTTVGSSSSPLYPRAIPVGQGGSTPAMAASTPHYMRPHLFGHDINTMLPRELCMVGCVFYIADYFSDFTMDVISNWQTIIQQHGGEVVSLYDSGRVTHVLCQHQKSPVFRQAVRENKRCITIYWVNDILIRGKMAPPWQAIHLPTPFGKDEKPMKDLLVSVTGFENDERTTIKLMLDLAGAQYTGYFSKHNNLLVCKKFEGLKVNKAKELKRSVVNGAWLSEVLLGQNTPPLVFQGTRYQHYLDDPLRIDPSLASHLFNAWKCPISVSKESVEKAKAMREMALRKRKSESDGDRENKRARGVDPSLSGPLSAGQSDSKSTIQLENDPTEERSCESQSRMQHPRIMLSSIKNKEEMEKKIIDMGGHMARANSEMSHLVMGASEAAPRTVKLLCALSCAQYIVSIQWLIDSSKQCKFLDERRYSLRMPEFERVFRFSLTEVMLKNRRRELFAGRHFFLTPSVVPGRSWLKEIIECAGGAVDVKRKSLREIRERNKDGKCQYICICSDEDSHLVNDLISERMPIFNSEFVMVSLMTQEMDWKATIFRPACVKWEDHSFLASTLSSLEVQDFVSHRSRRGLVFAVGFLCSHWIDQVDFAAYKPYSVFSDNIGGSTIDLMTNILPIDAVFTWVNGSDPVLLRSLRDLQEEKLFSCSYRHCFPSLYLVVHLEGPESEEALKGTYQSLTEVVRLTKGREERSVALIQMKSQGAFKALKEDIASLLGSNTSVFRAFWTSEVKVDLWAIERKIAAILKVTPNTDIKAELSNVAPGNYRKFFDSCSSVRHKDSYIVECPDESLLDLLKAAIEDYCKASNSKYPKIYPANLIYETSVTKEDYDINRFHDNEELRYSIRSIEKFAPWIRRLFLVTNGQIPYWLSLDHPKLTIVTHDQIFTNLSHLPTYSSPAIESHIHRIPGLSKHFLYLNDDVMFGSPVWPEDFFSKSTGYKVYLSWSLPECSSGCPGSWINDGFCDHPCNNSACDWDGDDCQRDGLEVPFDYFDRGDEGDSSLDSEYCAASCADTWLADSYCDSACNVMACGYDAGDCGEEIFRRNLFQINASNLKEDKMLVISDGAMAAWLDLNHLLKRWSNSTKVAGSSSRQKGLRVAALNKPSGFLVFVLRPNSSGTFDTRLDLGRGQTKSKVDEQVTFMVKFDTRERSSKQRLPKMNLTFTAENFNFSDKRSKIINLDLPKLYMNLSVDNVSLPVEVKRSLSHLSLQLQEDLLTQEGYLLKRAFILKSYFENEVSVSTNRPFVKRKLSSLDGRRTVGHFPWEKMGDDGGADLPPEGVLGRIGRRLLDRYAESLSFVNRLYNSEYGFHSRRVPAHIPHFIDRDIVEELQEKFSDEFDTTSSHKLRQGNDMQFALSYFYFLMSEKRIRSIGEIFREFDSDGSGTWSDREIRTFLVRTNDLPLTYSMILELHRELRNCSLKFETQPIPTTPYERYADSDLPTVSEELVTKCADSILAPRFKPSLRVARFFHTTTSDSEADFIMITSNLSTVIHHLDNVRKSAKKFLCFNSDLNPESKDNDLIRALLQDTYESLFPLPSSFELPANYRNRFLYTWEVAEWRRWRNLVRALIYASVSCLLLLTILTFCRSEIDRARRRWCRRFRNNKNIFGLAV